MPGLRPVGGKCGQDGEVDLVGRAFGVLWEAMGEF